MGAQIKVLILVLSGISGVLCKDNYDVGGMVAAAVIGALFLLAAIVMGLYLCFWPDYYHKQQLLRGKVRVVRPKKKWRWWTSKHAKTTVIKHPRSDIKQNVVRMYEINGAQKGSKNSTMEGRVRAGTWMHQVPFDTHETKSKTITLEHEEEPIIVADVLPAGTNEPIETTHTYTYTDASQSKEGGQYTVQEENVLRYTTSEPRQTQYTTTTETETLEPIHITLETQGYGEVRSDQVQTSQLRTTQVQSRPGQSEDIIISPIIPSGQEYQVRPATYQYQTTDYQIRTTSGQERQPVVVDNAVAQFGDGEIQNN